MRTRQLRTRGAVLAGAAAFYAALVFCVWIGALDSRAPWFGEGIVVAATIGGALGAAVVVPRLVGRRSAIGASAAEMTMIAYTTTALLWPLAAAITAAPSALSGGTVPCLFFGSGGETVCPHGLTASAAIVSLAGNTAVLYPFAILIDVFAAIPGLPVFFAFSLAWCYVFRRVMAPGAASATASTAPADESNGTR